MLSGGKTYIVSLPSKWIKSHKLKKGEEIDIKEEENNIIISTNKGKKAERAVVDISNTNTRYVMWSVYAAYVKGCDEIMFKYKNEEEKKLVEKAATQLIGFAIISEEKNRILIKDITGNENHFENVLRRIFLKIQTQLNLENLSKLSISEISLKDHEINQLCAFCQRYLNKYGFHTSKKTHALFAFISSLESLADEITDTNKTIIQNKNNINSALNKNYELIQSDFNILYNNFYNYKKELMINQLKEIKKALKKFRDLIKLQNKKEAILYTHFTSIYSQLLACLELEFLLKEHLENDENVTKLS